MLLEQKSMWRIIWEDNQFLCLKTNLETAPKPNYN